MRILPQSEKQMIQEVVTHLRDQNHSVALEVPFLNRSIDLVYQNNDGDLTAVEFKRHDWKRALQQAHDHRLGTDRVYICLPISVINENVEQKAKEIGVGIMAWSPDNPFLLHMDPSPSSITVPPVKNWLRESFTTRQNG